MIELGPQSKDIFEFDKSVYIVRRLRALYTRGRDLGECGDANSIGVDPGLDFCFLIGAALAFFCSICADYDRRFLRRGLGTLARTDH